MIFQICGTCGDGMRYGVRDRVPEREVGGGERGHAGKCMLGCHNERSRGIIARILSEGVSNSYTISKKGQRKLIHQTPWYKDAADGSGRTVAGIVELSVVIPEEMPHYDRG